VIPAAALLLRDPPRRESPTPDRTAAEAHGATPHWTLAAALRSWRFWTVSGVFAGSGCHADVARPWLGRPRRRPGCGTVVGVVGSRVAGRPLGRCPTVAGSPTRWPRLRLRASGRSPLPRLAPSRPALWYAVRSGRLRRHGPTDPAAPRPLRAPLPALASCMPQFVGGAVGVDGGLHLRRDGSWLGCG
jgi:hypothetical protein